MGAQQSFSEPAAMGGYMWFQSQRYGNWHPIDGCEPSVPFGCLAWTPTRLQEHYKMPLKSTVDSKYAGIGAFSGPQPRNQDNYSIQAANVSLMRNSNIPEQADFTYSLAMSSLGHSQEAPICRHRVARNAVWEDREPRQPHFFCKADLGPPIGRGRSRALGNPCRRQSQVGPLLQTTFPSADSF
jgi:hypothetical protein